MIIAARDGLFGGRTYTAKDYNQNGLVAVFDGIENAGYGIHDPNAVNWANLANRDYDAIGSGLGQWDDKCWTNESDGTAFHIGSIVAQTMDTRIFTVEMVAYTTRTDQEFAILANYDGYNGIVFDVNYSNRATWTRYFNAYNTWAASGMFPKGVPVYCAWTIDHVASQIVCYRNGNLYTRSSSNKTYSLGNRDTALGGDFNGNRPTLAFKGGIHAVRIYSRFLSANEIRKNYNVDRQRFHL